MNCTPFIYMMLEYQLFFKRILTILQLISKCFIISSFSLFSGITLFKGPQNKNLTYPVSLFKYFHIISYEIITV